MRKKIIREEKKWSLPRELTIRNEVILYEQGLEEYPKVGIILGNVAMILWIVLGFIGCWFLFPQYWLGEIVCIVV